MHQQGGRDVIIILFVGDDREFWKCEKNSFNGFLSYKYDDPVTSFAIFRLHIVISAICLYIY